MATEVVAELELVNLISISQVKLTNNFTILNRRLNKHDEIFNQYLNQMENNNTSVLNRINQVESHSNSQIDALKAQIKSIFQELQSLKQTNLKQQEKIQKNEQQAKKLNHELFNTQLQFQDKIILQNNQYADITQIIANIEKQINKMNDEIANKQGKVQVERVVKQIQLLRQKDTHFEAQIKLNEHKIQKIQILSQKNQRLQAKKDIQFFKQIQDKVKRQVKATLKGVNSPAIGSQHQTKTAMGSAQKMPITLNLVEKQNQPVVIAEEGQRKSIRKRLPFNLQEDQMLLSQLMKSNLDNPLSKINQRLNKLQVQQKDITEVIKSGKFAVKSTSGQMGSNIKDKINELKPEVIKLWAKFDTLQDRMAFNEKKMDEKNKILGDLVGHMKENNWQKMQQKVKTLQTQIYTNIKDVRAKMQTKVNITDYQKFVTSNDDRMRQINQLIYLKSDKLQVKKALLFLESKIKQIILVISEDEQNEKDALLTKKPIKCISCDKQVDKLSGNISGQKGNWDNLPYKQHAPQTLGRFGMTNYGALSKKLKKLEGKDLPLLNKKNNFGNAPSSP